MQTTVATYNHTNPALFCGGAAVVDYYGIDNDDYVAGAGFCCEPQAQTKNARSIPTENVDYEKLQYYYHSDYLGSASYITNLDGEVVQHIEYVPFGEVFLEERNNTWNTPFLFNGKELDEETGLYYYGARYYNPRISLWYGVDSLAEKCPGVSPYAYCANNPIMLVDPDGRDWEVTTTEGSDGNQKINLILTVAVLNSSSKTIDMDDFSEKYKSQLEDSFGISYEDKDGGAIDVLVDVQTRIITDESELSSDEHLLMIKDGTEPDMSGVYGYVNEIGGKEIYINADMVDNMLNGNDNNTLPHETGHTAGLNHIDIKAHAGPQFYNEKKQTAHSKNVMFSGGSKYMNDKTSTEINPQQIQWIYNASENNELNKN